MNQHVRGVLLDGREGAPAEIHRNLRAVVNHDGLLHGQGDEGVFQLQLARGEAHVHVPEIKHLKT